MKKLLLLAVLAAAVLIPASASAGKPVPTLVLDPTPVTAYGTYVVTGCHYPSSATLTMVVENSSSGGYPYFSVQVLTDAVGCLAQRADRYAGPIFFFAGDVGSDNEVTVWQNKRMLAHAVETVVTAAVG